MKRVLAGLLILAAWSDTHATLSDGLIMHYTFEDENDLGFDSSGNDNHGLATKVLPIKGRVGRGAFFGGDGMIVAQDFQNYDWGNAVTVCTWIRRTEPAMDYQGIVNAGYSAKGSWEVRLWPDNENAVLSAGVVSLAGPEPSDAQSPSTVVGEWYHVAFTYDSERFRFYVNGRLQPSAAKDLGAIRSMKQAVMVGSSGADSPRPQHFKGIIDEVRIYERALSEDEILALAAEGAEEQAGPPPQPEQTALDVDPAQSPDGASTETIPVAVTEPVPPPVVTAPIQVVESVTPARLPPTVEVKTSTGPQVSDDCCATLNQLMVDWLAGNREQAIRELDRLTRLYKR